MKQIYHNKYIIHKYLNEKVQKMIVGFAAGVMIAASVWSLILPAVEMAESQGITAWLPPAVRSTIWSYIFNCN